MSALVNRLLRRQGWRELLDGEAATVARLAAAGCGERYIAAAIISDRKA